MEYEKTMIERQINNVLIENGRLYRVNGHLMEALEHCVDVMNDPWKHGDRSISQAIDKARASIAKAKGEGA